MRIYIDIDGVLLANEENAALHADELIDYLVNNHDLYWLTTHCRGDSVPTQQHIARQFPSQNTLRNLGRINATNWDTWKTEAIDFSEPFLWLDDDLFDEEKQELEAHQALDSFVMIDLRQDPEQLKKVIDRIRARTQ